VKHQESLKLSVVLCTQNFPCKNAPLFYSDHIVLEKWSISPLGVESTDSDWQVDEELDWDEDPMYSINASLPLKENRIPAGCVQYGVSPISPEIQDALSRRAVILSHHKWNTPYLVSVEYSHLPGESWKTFCGSILLEVEDHGLPVSCHHTDQKEELEDFTGSPQESLKCEGSPSESSISSARPISRTKRADGTPLSGSPRYPAYAMRPHRQRSRSAHSSNGVVTGSRLSYTSTTVNELAGSFVGSLQESLLSGHMSMTKSSVFSGFTAKISATSSGSRASSSHLKIPFDTYHYHLEDYNKTPYVGSIFLPKGRFRIAPAGQLQVTIFNPSNTPVKVFVVQYDLTDMPPNSKTFLRQITRTALPPHILHYAVQFTIICSKSNRYYLYNNVRTVFPHRKPDDRDALEVVCQSPSQPQFFKA